MDLGRQVRALKFGFIGLTVILIGVAIIAITRPIQASPDPGTCLPVSKGGTGCDSAETVSFLADALYPVGSVLISTTSANPSTYLGGTWVAWGSGRVPVGVDTGQTEFDTVEETGGNKEVQQHSHSWTGTQVAAGDIVASHQHGIGTIAAAGEGSHIHYMNNHTHGLNNHTHGVGTLATGGPSTASTGAGTAHNHGPGNLTRFITADNAVSGTTTTASTTTTSTTRVYPYANSGATISTYGQTANESSHTHSMQSHTHGLSGSTGGNTGSTAGSGAQADATANSRTGGIINTSGTSTTHTHTMSGSTAGAGASVAYTPAGSIGNYGAGTTNSKNLQPYITCYMWKRTN